MGSIYTKPNREPDFRWTSYGGSIWEFYIEERLSACYMGETYYNKDYYLVDRLSIKDDILYDGEGCNHAMIKDIQRLYHCYLLETALVSE